MKKEAQYDMNINKEMRMRKPKLIIANKKYSSWSLRPWLALKVKDIEFEEELSGFDHATNHVHFWEFSPTKKVPVLVLDGQSIWESLAILEALADAYPDKGLWPDERKKRAHARAVSAEMHSGFGSLRIECPMNMARTPARLEMSEATQTDVRRIETSWKDCLNRYGGPFLFGDFTNADAMYAPVVNRFQVYQVGEQPDTLRYMETIAALPAWQAWEADGNAESWISEVNER